MSETKLTKELKQAIWFATKKMGVFGCFEVTIGFNGNERVDYITVDTRGVWRCYEIKVSESDFHSKSKNTFIGHYNYYVIPKELHEKIKNEIPKHIGVFVGKNDYAYCDKRATRQQLGANENILQMSIIRSLNRETEKLIRAGNKDIINNYEREISQIRSAYQESQNKYYEIWRELQELKYKKGDLLNV